ncbi:Uncharacterized protein Fot_06758 [Forsythia ovata]|uniref:Uncharacterized protein n=1 Tax=Forsythia ovata TaxID=205694 RepID=A0ABD1WTV4_9LAMI
MANNPNLMTLNYNRDMHPKGCKGLPLNEQEKHQDCNVLAVMVKTHEKSINIELQIIMASTRAMRTAAETSTRRNKKKSKELKKSKEDDEVLHILNDWDYTTNPKTWAMGKLVVKYMDDVIVNIFRN